MEQSSWQIRRARLVDVPAVARLLGDPPSQRAHSRAGLSARTVTSAGRLLLTHVALEHGQFWVAEGGGQIRAAVVLLPPAVDAVQQRLHSTLRLELGIPASAIPGPDWAAGAVPPESWFMLAAPVPASSPVLADLLHTVLQRPEVENLPVVAIQPGLPAPVLAEAGFDRLPAAAGADPSDPPLLLRPAAIDPAVIDPAVIDLPAADRRAPVNI